MAEDYVKREECRTSLDRTHSRMDEMVKLGVQIETSAKIMEKNVSDMHKVIYGNGRDGVISKVTILFTRINIQWYLLGLLIAGLVGTAWIIVRLLYIGKIG